MTLSKSFKLDLTLSLSLNVSNEGEETSIIRVVRMAEVGPTQSRAGTLHDVVTITIILVVVVVVAVWYSSCIHAILYLC